MGGRVSAKKYLVVRGSCLRVGHVCTFIFALPLQPLPRGLPSFCRISLKLPSPVLPQPKHAKSPDFDFLSKARPSPPHHVAQHAPNARALWAQPFC